MRSNSIEKAIVDLSQKVDPQKFSDLFGDTIDNISQLIITKTVTIPKLMSIAPEGTNDPTSTLYNSTMFLMAFLLAIALVANYLIKPVDPKHHM